MKLADVVLPRLVAKQDEVQSDFDRAKKRERFYQEQANALYRQLYDRGISQKFYYNFSNPVNDSLAHDDTVKKQGQQLRAKGAHSIIQQMGEHLKYYYGAFTPEDEQLHAEYWKAGENIRISAKERRRIQSVLTNVKKTVKGVQRHLKDDLFDVTMLDTLPKK